MIDFEVEMSCIEMIKYVLQNTHSSSAEVAKQIYKC